MRRRLSSAALVLGLLAGCSEEEGPSVPQPQPPEKSVEGARVSRGQARIRTIDWEPEYERWQEHWLESFGWVYFGYEVEAGSAGSLEMRWTDPRIGQEREITSFRIELKENVSVNVIFGVMASPTLESVHTFACPNCGTRSSIEGWFLPSSVECRKCNRRFTPKGDRDPTSSFPMRLLVHGDHKGVRAFGTLRSKAMKSGWGGRASWFIGDVEAVHVIPEEGVTFDPAAAMRDGRDLMLSGAEWRLVSLGLHVPGDQPSGLQRTRTSDQYRFRSSSGNVVVSGDEKGFRIEVAGIQVPVDQYLHAVRRIEARFRS
ncbi:MAG: zinc ribbon domain-containing protein [Planctomycetota bacterium]|jgi:hypothetical protein